MEKKMFGQESRFGSPRQHLLKMFRLMRGLSNGALKATACTTCTDSNDDSEQPNVFNLRAYLAAKQRVREIETEKAMILKELRHENWKAGGPV